MFGCSKNARHLRRKKNFPKKLENRQSEGVLGPASRRRSRSVLVRKKIIDDSISDQDIGVMWLVVGKSGD